MKKIYTKPVVAVCKLQSQGIICTSLNSIDGNAAIGYGGGSDEPARAPQTNVWDELELE